MNISKAFDRLQEDINDVQGLADKLYNNHFEHYFTNMRSQYAKFMSPSGEMESSRISDADLESILSELPLQLFAVSEELGAFKLNQETIKLKIKELDVQLKKSKGDDMSCQAISNEIDEDKLVQSIYSSVVTRVEGEISFSREFIMVLKKFWDARRATEQVNPVNEAISGDLPEYEGPKTTHRYIQ